MENETIKNTMFGMGNIFLLISVVSFSERLASNTTTSRHLYTGHCIEAILFSILGSIGLVVFGLLILGNLNDFVLRRCVNLIGAAQKLQIFAILLLINGGIHSGVTCWCALAGWSSLNKKMASILLSAAGVVLFHVILVYLSYILHPDLFGYRNRKEINHFYGESDNEVYDV